MFRTFLWWKKVPWSGFCISLWWSQSTKTGTHQTFLSWCGSVVGSGPSKCSSSTLQSWKGTLFFSNCLLFSVIKMPLFMFVGKNRPHDLLLHFASQVGWKCWWSSQALWSNANTWHKSMSIISCHLTDIFFLNNFSNLFVCFNLRVLRSLARGDMLIITISCSKWEDLNILRAQSSCTNFSWNPFPILVEDVVRAYLIF